jgi:hypothetical protein
MYNFHLQFFSETAHNPETNQRPLQTTQAAAAAAQLRSSLMPIVNAKRQEPFSMQSVTEKQQQQQQQLIQHQNQEALYSSLIPSAATVVVNTNRNAYAGNGNPMIAVVQPRILQNSSTSNQMHVEIPQQHQQQQLAGFKNQYTSPINSEVKDAILSRLRHQIEQKEEFLKRPNKPLILEPTTSQSNGGNNNQQRATLTFSQPNRLKVDGWNLADYNRMQQQQQHSVSQELTDIQNNRFALREQFFKDRNSTQNAYFSLPTSPYYAQDSQQSNSSFIGSSNSMAENTSIKSDDNRHLRVIGSSPIPSQGLHIVSERTKQFESGRPLSPDGIPIDRTQLYKSELSR